MFLDWVSSLELLEQGKETNILRDFSLPVRRILVSQVVNLFLDPNTTPNILSTNAHVHWVMECIGQGFLLPVDDLPVIVACIDLYKRWLLESNVKPRPPPISEDEQHFTRVMLEHLSLIFTPRVGVPKESTDVHTVLCQRVLSIFLEFARTCKPSTETWEVVLKLLLGTSDCLLGGERGADENQTKAIAPFLLKVVFEVWLHARTTDPELWGSLVKLTGKWLHWMPMAAQWNATTLGLTNRLLTLLYPSPDTAVQQFPYATIRSSESDFVNIDLSPELVYYAWHRMFHVMGNLNNLSNPAIFVCAMTGLNNLVCQFLKVGRTVDQRDKPDVSRPDGNTILHIFGSWLFEAVKLNRTSFDEGTSIAVETLNHIFNACQHYKLEPVYLASYYTCMAEALASDGRVLMSAIQYGQWLVFSELPGARVLVPLYISAVSKILPLSVPYHPSVTPPDVIRRCCIKIIGGLICLPNRFGDLTIPQIHNKAANTASQKALADIVSFKDTLPHLSHLLLAGLSSEKNPHNCELLLWYLPIFLREIAAAVQGGGGSPVSPAEFTVGAVEVIIANICGNTWPNEVSQAACRVLSSLSRMYTCFGNGPELGYSITKSLCEYAISRIGLTPQDEELCSAIIMSVTDWIVVDQWLITKRGALEVFIDVCMLGLGARDHTPENEPAMAAIPAGARTTISPIKKVRAPPGEKLKQASQHGLLNVLHNMGNFPAATGPSRISSLVSEEDVLLKIKELDPTVTDSEEYVRYFIVDESCIISVIDIPNGTSDPTCVIVIRDRTGKYVWNANKPYLPFNPKKDVEQEEKDQELLPSESTDDLTRGLGSPVRATPGGPESTGNSPSLTRPRALVSEGSHGDLKLLVAVEADLSSRNHAETYQDMITYISGHSDETFLILADGVLQNETSLLSQFKDQTMAVSIATQPPARRNPYLGPCKFQLGRQLLTSLGLFSPCHSKVVPLHPGPALSACMKAMDSTAERAQYKVGVIYAGKGQTVDEVFANVQGSSEYNRFIAALGWPVYLPTHKGFNGGLDGKGQYGTEAPYYASYSLETIFLVTSFMPNQFLATEPAKPVTTHKKNLLRGTPVVVVWSEDHRFDTTTLTEGVPLQIVIVPQSSGMFRVRILKTTSISKIPIGPISEDVVVSRQVLGDMIRETAIVASQLISPLPHPYANRRSYIEQMSRSFKSPNMAVDAFYGKIFGAMPKTTFQPVSHAGKTDPRGGRPPHAGVFKGIISAPPPPPSVLSSTSGTPDKFTHSNSSDFLLHHVSSDISMPRNLSETSLSNHPINSLNSSVNSLNSSGDSVKSFDGEPVKRVPSFGTKEPTPPSLTPISSTPPTSLSNPLLSHVGISAKSHSMSELPSHELASIAASAGSKPGSPSPPTSPPLLATSPGSSTPPANTFLRAKISRSGSPMGRAAHDDTSTAQTPVSPQPAPLDPSTSSTPAATTGAASSTSSSSTAPTSTTSSRPAQRPGLFVLGRGNKQ